MLARDASKALLVLTLSALPAVAGMIITPTFASNITSDPNSAAIIAGINAAISQYAVTFSDPINVPITFQEGSGLGSSSTNIAQLSYGAYRTALAADAKTTDDATALANLPVQAASPVDGNTNMWVTVATLDAVGIAHGPVASYGTITLNTSIMNFDRVTIDPSKYDLQGVAMHEIDEVLGLGSGLNLPVGFPRLSRPQDLFRYSAAGVRSFSTSGVAAYFSIDGGTSNLVGFHSAADGEDFGDWLNSGTSKVQDAEGTPGAIPTYAVEIRALDVIGFDAAVPEPGTVFTVAAGFGLLTFQVRRRRR